MTERWRVLALMTTAQAGSSVVQQALGSLSPVLVATFALSKAQLGVVFSAILFGATCFTAISGALTDRWGERKMLLGSAIVMVAALLGATAAVDYTELVAMMVVFGVGYAASTPAGGRAILAWFDRDRGLAMGIRQTGVAVGALAGALGLPAVAAVGGYRAAFVLAALLVALPSTLAYVLYREATPVHGAVQVRLRYVARAMLALARDPRLIAVTLTSMLLSAGQFIMNAFLTITAVSVAGLSVRTAGFALAFAFVMAICGRLGWGALSDRYCGGDRLVPLAATCVVASIGAALLAVLRGGGAVQLFVAAGLLGVSAAGWNGLMAAALSEIGGADRAASALGVGLTGIFAASAVGPWAFGSIADEASLQVAWSAVAVMLLFAAAPVLWLHQSRASAT